MCIQYICKLRTTFLRNTLSLVSIVMFIDYRDSPGNVRVRLSEYLGDITSALCHIMFLEASFCISRLPGRMIGLFIETAILVSTVSTIYHTRVQYVPYDSGV